MKTHSSRDIVEFSGGNVFIHQFLYHPSGKVQLTQVIFELGLCPKKTSLLRSLSNWLQVSSNNWRGSGKRMW